MSDDQTTADPGIAEDCISNRPWSEVLNRSAKMLTFQAAREGGKSVGRLVFFVALGLGAVACLGWAAHEVTGWMGGIFDFWPFSSGAEEEPARSWFARPEPAPAAEKWYCTWTPFC